MKAITFSGTARFIIKDVKPFDIDKFVAVGYVTNTARPTELDAFMAIFDADGNIQDNGHPSFWQGNDQFFEVEPTDDGGFVCAGYCSNTPDGKTKVCLVKYDKNINIVYTQQYGETNSNVGYNTLFENGVSLVRKDNFLYVGSINSGNNPSISFPYILKADVLTGKKIRDTTYRGVMKRINPIFNYSNILY